MPAFFQLQLVPSESSGNIVSPEGVPGFFGVSPVLVLVFLPRENPTAGAVVGFGCAWGNSWIVPPPGTAGSD